MKGVFISWGLEGLPSSHILLGTESQTLWWIFFFWDESLYPQSLKGICDSKEVEEPLIQRLEFNKDYYGFLQTMNKLHSQLFAETRTCNPRMV